MSVLTGVIEHDIQSTEATQCIVNYTLNFLLTGYISLENQCLRIWCGFLYEGVGFIGRVHIDVHKNDFGTLNRK